jgi:hypothetical protein
MLYDVIIDEITYHCETPIESLEELYEWADRIGVTYVRENYSEYPTEMQDTIGKHGEWMDMLQLEALVYEYNTTRI